MISCRVEALHKAMQLVCNDDMENVLHADDIISAPAVTGNYPSIRGELQHDN